MECRGKIQNQKFRPLTLKPLEYMKLDQYLSNQIGSTGHEGLKCGEFSGSTTASLRQFNVKDN